MGYTQEQIDRANQVDLEQFLRSQGEQLIKSGNEYRWKRHDSLTVRGNKWFRHSQSVGGYPVEFVMEFYGKTFPEAVQMLIGEAPIRSEAVTPTAVFRLPPKNHSNENMNAYLRQRIIPEELIQEFYREGLIYEEAHHHNIVFVGRDVSGVPRYAHCKGTGDGFRVDVAGSDKSCSFAYRSDGTSLFVFEAPIDLMSFIALYPEDWRDRNYLSLGGVGAKALAGFLSERQDLETIYHDCGQFYFWKIDDYVNNTTGIWNTVPYVMSEEETQDVDTETDFRMAEMKYGMIGKRLENI